MNKLKNKIESMDATDRVVMAVVILIGIAVAIGIISWITGMVNEALWDACIAANTPDGVLSHESAAAECYGH